MGAVERERRRVNFADLKRAPDDGRRYELYDGEVLEVLRREAGSYVLVQRAAGDPVVESAVLPGTALRAGSIFP
jgi:hypothetical protein